MRTSLNLLAITAALIGTLAIGTSLHAQMTKPSSEDSAHSMMGDQKAMSGMNGMMGQMSQMMESCNSMMKQMSTQSNVDKPTSEKIPK